MRSSSADPAELRRFGLDDRAGIGGVRASSWAVEDGLARYRRACPDHPLAGATALLAALHRWTAQAEDTAAWVTEVAAGFALADLAAGEARPATLAEAVWVFEAHRATFDTARDVVRGRWEDADGFVSLDDLWAVAMSGHFPPGLAEAARLLLALARIDDAVAAVFTPPSTWDRLGGWVHLSLDLAGMVPVAGDLADLVNAGIFAVEGKRLDAVISLAAAVGAGQAGSTSRAVRATTGARPGAAAPGPGRALREALSGVVAANDAYQVVDGAVDGDWKRVLGGGLPLGSSLRNPVARAAVMGGTARLAITVATEPQAGLRGSGGRPPGLVVETRRPGAPTLTVVRSNPR